MPAAATPGPGWTPPGRGSSTPFRPRLASTPTPPSTSPEPRPNQPGGTGDPRCGGSRRRAYAGEGQAQDRPPVVAGAPAGEGVVLRAAVRAPRRVATWLRPGDGQAFQLPPAVRLVSGDPGRGRHRGLRG